MGFALIHGGAHQAAHWAPLLSCLDGPVVALDLPGRSSRPADIRTLTLEGIVASAVADIQATGWERVTVVGHSLAGVVLPEIVARLAGMIHHVVYVSCLVPSAGRSFTEALPPPLRAWARWQARRGVISTGPLVARLVFCSGMTPAERRFVLDRLCPEPASIIREAVPASPWPEGVGRTYVLLTRDRALPPWTQRRQIARLGDCEVVLLGAHHDAFVTHASELAGILNRYRPEPSPNVPDV